MTADEGRRLRLARLRALLSSRGLDAIVLRRPPNFAWYTGGADSRVDHVSPVGVADVVVTADAELVLTSSIEAPRMRAEQVPTMDVAAYPWFDGPTASLREIAGGHLGTDLPLPGEIDLSEEVASLRRVLDPDAVARLRAVGRDTEAAMAETAATVVPGISELDVAAELAAACRRRGLSSSVLLAAADERIEHHRHPLPVGAAITRRAMLVVSAERGGLYANVTRFVELEEPSPDLARRIAACDEILRRLREESTRAGRTLADVFGDVRGFYAEADFPGEESLHHQGGTTGYGSREVIATPTTFDPIVPGQAFAWNPSITGAKAEETFLLHEDGPELIASGAPERLESR